MDVSEAVARRMSVRAFKPDPVPGAVVREILEAAKGAPSGGNLQPWRVYALAGASLVFPVLSLITAESQGSVGGGVVAERSHGRRFGQEFRPIGQKAWSDPAHRLS